jgi:hypothetical protein
MDLLKMTKIPQRFEKIVVNDIGGEIRSQMNVIDLKGKITPGGSVDQSLRANVGLNQDINIRNIYHRFLIRFKT